ncbi:MAG: hypothetical protein ACR2G3_11105 [Solirubrobacterales bacterium]
MQEFTRRLAAATALAAVAIPAFAFGAAQQIEITDDQFTPQKAPIVGAGTTSHSWQWLGDHAHNVRQDRRLFYSGPPAVDDTFLISASAGTFPYYCEIHGGPGTGMHGTLRIRPAQVAMKTKRGVIQIGVRWAPDSPQTGDQFDVQYRVEQGDWKSWRKNTSKTEASFGSNDNPVDVKPGKTYRFRARSEVASNPSRASAFSPPLVVVPG